MGNGNNGSLPPVVEFVYSVYVLNTISRGCTGKRERGRDMEIIGRI